jgi:hypothetical protein
MTNPGSSLFSVELAFRSAGFLTSLKVQKLDRVPVQTRPVAEAANRNPR